MYSLEEARRKSLSLVLFNGWNGGITAIWENVIALVAYYGSNALPGEIGNGVAKLQCKLPTLQMFQSLLHAQERRHTHDFRWEPHLRENGDASINLSPTFSVHGVDDSKLISEIDKLRIDLEREPVDLVPLIHFIKTRAHESGDLAQTIQGR